MCLQLAGDVREYCLCAGAVTAGLLARDCWRGTAGTGLLTRDCWHGVCIAASFTWEGEGCSSWIGSADPDRKR